MRKVIRPHKNGFAIVFKDIFQANFFNGGCWFRIYGYGLNLLNRKKYPPVFSSRKQKQFFGWTCKILTKSQIQD